MIRGKQFYTKDEKLIDITEWNTSGNAMDLGNRYGWEGAMAWGNLIHDELNAKGPGIQPGDIYLDLGANIGMSAMNAELKGASKLYCIEPDPGVFSALDMNKGENWEIFNIAISNTNGEMDIPKWPNWWENEPRPCFTLDNFFEDNSISHIDYMKVDIEGHEKYVFEDVKQETWDKIDKMFIEYHENKDISKYARNVERDNFSRFFLSKGFNQLQSEVGEHQSFIYIWRV
jgi:FkbM family methyltransferase